nr:O-antigen ligase family protein [uncultured Sphaerochaeta sp.]
MIETTKIKSGHHSSIGAYVFDVRSKKVGLGFAPTLIALIVASVIFVTKYYFESDLIILSLIIISFLFVLTRNITIIQFCLVFLPFNTSTAAFGNSVMLYCLLFSLLYTILKYGVFSISKVHLDFSFWLMLFLVLISVKNIVVYTSFRDLTFMISIIMIGIIIKNNIRYNTLVNEFIPYGIVIIAFGILQLFTGNGVGIRYAGNALKTQLSGTYEPNYYSLYLNTFLAVILFSKASMKFFFKAFLIIISSLLVLLVRSNTGILTLLSIYTIKILSDFSNKDQTKLIKLLSVLVFGMIGLLVVPDIGISIINNSRLVQTILGFLNTGDVNTFTTGRAGIWSQYFQSFNQQSLIDKLFGSSLTIFRDKYGIIAYTHNFWVDVLVETGIIGFVFYFVSLVIIYYRYFKNKRKELSQFFGLAILLIFILYSLTLSLYSERTTWTMAILLLYQSRRKTSHNMMHV